MRRNKQPLMQLCYIWWDNFCHLQREITRWETSLVASKDTKNKALVQKPRQLDWWLRIGFSKHRSTLRRWGRIREEWCRALDVNRPYSIFNILIWITGILHPTSNRGDITIITNLKFYLRIERDKSLYYSWRRLCGIIMFFQKRLSFYSVYLINQGHRQYLLKWNMMYWHSIKRVVLIQNTLIRNISVYYHEVMSRV